MLFWVLNILLKVVFILLAVAFVTLFERKVLGYSQHRMGPNKILFNGLFQPVLDGLKLFMKECFFPGSSVYILFIMGPVISFLTMILMWMVLKEESMFFSMKMMVMFFMCCLGLSVYSTLLSGWSSVSKFASLGSVRSCSQSISYEVSMALFFISFMVIYSTMKLYNEMNFMFIFIFIPLVCPWVLSCLAETNRAPFDFSEGESELISGFNIEFGAITFTLLFLAEYGMILFFSIMSSFLLFNYSFVMSWLMIFMFLLIRSVYPRFRYDKLMSMTWTIFLPLSILFVFYFILL